VLLIHGDLVLVPELADLEHGQADDVLVDLLKRDARTLRVADDLCRFRCVAAQQCIQVCFSDRNMPSLQKLLRYLDVVHCILGDENGFLQVAFCQINLLTLEEFIGEQRKHLVVIDHLDLDAVAVEVLHEVAQELKEPHGVVGKNILVLQIDRSGEEAEVIQDILEHQLLAPLVHLNGELGVGCKLPVEDFLGQGYELWIDARKQKTHG